MEFECKDAKEKKAIKNFAMRNFPAAAKALCSLESMKPHICVESTKQTMKQVTNYAKNPDCMLKVSTANSVSSFCNTQFYLQLCEMCPHLVYFLTGICKSGKSVGKTISAELGKEVEPKLRNAVCASAAICLNQCNQKLSVCHYRNGLMLLHGGVKASSLDKCHRLSLTVSHKSCIRMQKKFGDSFDENVLRWTEETKEREMMIRFFEEAKQKLLDGNDLINLSSDGVRAFKYFDEGTHKQCLHVLKEIGEHGMDLQESGNVTLPVIQNAIDHLRGSINHFK